MSLQLILGNSGSGKSYQLYKQIIEASIQSPEKNFLVIVPEQFTMQTQRKLVAMHPQRGLLNIDILSFQRLAHRIFEEVGADRRTVLEETGKTLLLRRTVMKKQNQLKILKGNLKKQGYLLEMKSLISELTQYDIDADKMEQLQTFSKDRPSLYYKLQDIDIIYEGFQEELEGKYITAEETLEALCQVVSRSELLKDSIVAIDGFTGFTPIQQKLLRELLQLAGQVLVTVTIDAKEDFYRIRGEHELFYLSKKTIHSLTGLARQSGCEILPPVIMQWKEMPRFKNSRQLGFLEEHLFRGRISRAENEQESIFLHTAANPVQEAHFAARTIRRYIMKGYRYQDIAVIVGDLPSYNSYIPKIFQEYQIPCFMDSNRSVFSNPFIEFVRALLDMISQNFTCTAVFRYLRTNLCAIEMEHLDILENYVLAAGVRGFSSWSEEFTKIPDSIPPEKAELCEELRKQIMEPLHPVVGCLKSSRTTVAEKTKVLYELIVFYEIQRQMAVKEEMFRKAGKPELQKEYAGIYGIVMGLLDKLVQLLGEEKISLQEYTQLLEAGFEEARVGLIPASNDRIQVGDLERSRLSDIKVLIFLGLNDGWVPSGGNGGGLLSDIERELLEKSGIELAPTARQNSYIQKFYLYLNLTKPREYLHLSFSKASTDGTLMRPSYVIRSVQRLFPNMEVTEEDVYTSFTDRIFTPQNGLSYLVEGLQKVREENPDGQWLELYRWYLEQDTEREKVEKLVKAAFMTFDGRGIGKEAARRLYGEMLAGSVSRLEKFASCAFAHFLQYGLKLEEREEYEFRPVDMGNVFHNAIERYSEKIKENGYDWFTISEEESNELIEQCVEEVAENYGQQILRDSARNEYLIRRMKRIMHRTVWALHRQISAGHFYPDGFEVSFSQARELEAVNIALTEEERMRLRGRIDRIDVCEKDKQVYVKVIDYKSGNTSFDLVALYHGLQLQLVVYLNAALELEKRLHPDKEIIPAGIFYYHMKDPLLDMEGVSTPEEIEKQLLKQLRPDGLVNMDQEVFSEMDRGFTKTSDVIPVTLNKDGSLSKLSRAISKERFGQMSELVHEKLKEIGSRIMDGEIAPVPYQRKQQTGCDYCIYRAVCALDGKIPGTGVNRLKEYKAEEIWKKMEEDSAWE
ncbi:MAG: helicase-exonuclease AddAB subunit AddB [Eubacteriales bacterium]|nr:helicase-exonuclease AddAB subunit AddB [Eubacteriales bacterium]